MPWSAGSIDWVRQGAPDDNAAARGRSPICRSYCYMEGDVQGCGALDEPETDLEGMAHLRELRDDLWQRVVHRRVPSSGLAGR